ncbi:MAG: type II toxin-antitoxin system VapC family toxin [Vicinamibacterales bacterium]
MTLYLDTSSLVKLYVEEAGSDEVRQDLAAADVVVTSAVAFPEARATFARLRRDGAIPPATLRAMKRDLDADWPRYLVVEPTTALCRAAGELAERYRLRGFDSIHLASFLQVAKRARPSDTHFSSFDRRLNRAASAAVHSATRR